jgi:hypothetical protein
MQAACVANAYSEAEKRNAGPIVQREFAVTGRVDMNKVVGKWAVPARSKARKR